VRGVPSSRKKKHHGNTVKGDVMGDVNLKS